MVGYFLVFEGPDGSGKTTVINSLKDYLISKGHSVIVTREPGGTVLGEDIRKILLDKKNTDMNFRTEVLLYAAARAQHVDEIIKPYLEKNYIVICDRFVLSSLAYQGGARDENIDNVKNINDYAIDGINPDRTIFVDLDPEVGLCRKDSQEELDRLEMESINFHKKVYSSYKKLLESYPYKYSVVDGANSKEDVYNQCLKIVMEDIQ